MISRRPSSVSSPRLSGLALRTACRCVGTAQRVSGTVAAVLRRASIRMGSGMIGRLAPDVSIPGPCRTAALWSQAQAAHPDLNQTLKLRLVRYSAMAGATAWSSSAGNLPGDLLRRHGHDASDRLCERRESTRRTCCHPSAGAVLRQSLGASRLRIVRAQLGEGLACRSLPGLPPVCLPGDIESREWFSRLPTNPGKAAMPDFTPDWTVIGYALCWRSLARSPAPSRQRSGQAVKSSVRR